MCPGPYPTTTQFCSLSKLEYDRLRIQTDYEIETDIEPPLVMLKYQ